MSGTQGMRNGDIFGSGIYLAADVTVSLMYAESGYTAESTVFARRDLSHSHPERSTGGTGKEGKGGKDWADEADTEQKGAPQQKAASLPKQGRSKQGRTHQGRFRVVMACDVIDLPCNRNTWVDKKDPKKGTYYVVPDSEHVRNTALLLFYDRGGVKQVQHQLAGAGGRGWAVWVVGFLFTVALALCFQYYVRRDAI